MMIQPLQVSKWLHVQALLDPVELSGLLDDLGEISIYNTSQALPEGESAIDKDTFLNKYQEYFFGIKSGDASNLPELRPFLSSAITCASDHLQSVVVSQNRQIMRVCKPVIQLQLHSIGYSSLEHKFRSMIFSPDSIPWGLQFSYPQLYQDPETKEVSNIRTDRSFPNTHLFRMIQKWIRENTLPTPFVVEGQRINVPMRLGKECFSWINEHPKLRDKEIGVVLKTEEG